MTTLTDDEVQSIQDFLAESATTGAYWKTVSAVRKLWKIYNENLVPRTGDVGKGFPAEGSSIPMCIDPDDRQYENYQ